MRVLLLHCDWIEFEAKRKAVKSACELIEKTGRMTDCIVCFMAVEKPDEKNLSEVVDKLGEVIDSMATQVKAESIVLYPYAHLSSDLSSLESAEKTLNLAYERVSAGYKTLKAPFGWYKSFGLHCKGHPLSELSRTITVGGESESESQALAEEDKIVSHWQIMDDAQNLHELEGFDFKEEENLRKLASYEKEKKRQADKPPIHIEYMRRLELADYEPASDGGNLRYYPKGRMIKALVEEYVGEKIRDYGGLEVESPIMYDFNHPTLAKYLHRFPARQYTIESDKKNFFLRFAACFGQFLMAHDATLSYRNLPLRLYELARYAFRREKSGELTGLRRLRAFTMPDVHALCTDVNQAMDEYKKRFRLCIETIEGIGFTKDDFELAVRVTKGFYEQNKDFVGYLVKEYGKPALVEMWDERKFYFVLKYEFNFVDESDKASALSTDQIDVENGQRYDINFIDESGESQHPVILHCSPSGAIERVIYALLEKAGKDAKIGAAPSLPLWLSPTQIRFIPVSDKQFDACRKMIGEVEGVRVDVDDRSESMGKKIRQAEKEWVPYIAVLGEKELQGGYLTVRVRGQKQQSEMKLGELLEKVRSNTSDKPFRDTPLPKYLSMRPKFVG